MDYRLALILLVVSFLLFLKFRKFPAILLPSVLIIAIPIFANLGTLRDEFRFRQAKFEIAGNAEAFFNRKFGKPVMVLARDAFVNINGQRQKSDPVYALQGYAGKSMGHSVEAVVVLGEQDCDVGLLVKASPNAMKLEFHSRTERMDREFDIIRRRSKNIGDKKSSDNGEKRIELFEVDRIAKNLEPIPSGLKWCKHISNDFFYCEASQIDLMFANGIKF